MIEKLSSIYTQYRNKIVVVSVGINIVCLIGCYILLVRPILPIQNLKPIEQELKTIHVQNETLKKQANLSIITSEQADKIYLTNHEYSALQRAYTAKLDAFNLEHGYRLGLEQEIVIMTNLSVQKEMQFKAQLRNSDATLVRTVVIVGASALVVGLVVGLIIK